MAMNGLKNLADTLADGSNEIRIDAAAGEKALRGIQRMLDFAGSRKPAARVIASPQYAEKYAQGMGPA